MHHIMLEITKCSVYTFFTSVQHVISKLHVKRMYKQQTVGPQTVHVQYSLKNLLGSHFTSCQVPVHAAASSADDDMTDLLQIPLTL